MSETGTHLFEWPTLHLAARAGGVREIKRKIERGADVSAQDKDGNSLLHLAIWNNHEPLARALAEMGVDIELQDKHGNTPLHIAAYLGNVEIVELLLVLKANREAKDNEGHTPLEKAEEFKMQKAHRQIITLLKQ